MLSFASRLLFGANEADDGDKFRVVLGELGSLSETTGQLQFRVRALEEFSRRRRADSIPRH